MRWPLASPGRPPNLAKGNRNDVRPLHRLVHSGNSFGSSTSGKEMLVPAAEAMLQKVPVLQRVISSRAPNDDPTLIEPIDLAA